MYQSENIVISEWINLTTKTERLDNLYAEQINYVLENNLTYKQREQVVLALLTDGATTHEVADMLNMTLARVKLYATHAIENYKPSWAV